MPASLNLDKLTSEKVSHFFIGAEVDGLSALPGFAKLLSLHVNKGFFHYIWITDSLCAVFSLETNLIVTDKVIVTPKKGITPSNLGFIQ